MGKPLSPETAKTLADTVGMVKLIDQQDKKIQPRYRKFYDGLKAAIADSSADEIALYRPQLEKVGEEIDESLATIQGALTFLGELRQDEVLMATRFEQVEKLMKLVATTRKKLADQAAEARKLDAEVEKALVAIKKSDVAEEADLGALQAAVKGLMKSIDYVDTEAPKLEQAARKAWDQKKQKELTDARVKLIDFLKFGTAATAMRPRIEKFKKQYPDLDRERKAEVQWMLDDLQRAEDRIKQVDKVVKELVALGQVPPEEKKAPPPAPTKFDNATVMKVLKAFDLDADDAGKRAKAQKILNTCPVDQWPKELGKLYGAKESELKAKLPGVRKIPLVRESELIDI